MTSAGTNDQQPYFLATANATRREQDLALIIAIGALLVFIAAVPFARVPLAKFPAFIPSCEAALFFIDLITAILLFDQFIRIRSVAFLALAGGYLFDAFIIVPHALTFPGAFTANGLLGAKEQTTAWLYIFWHGGFPFFVIAYAVLRRHEESGGQPPQPLDRPFWVITATVAAVTIVVALLTVLATAGHDLLPVVMQGSDYSLLVRKGISPAVWTLTLVAMITLWRKQQRVVDLWLTLVMWIWLFDIALAAVIGSARFDLGFYAGRIFGVIAASFLLITLIVETARLYTGAIIAAIRDQTRLAEVVRSRAHHELAQGSSETFIHRQNIARYRSLLDSEQLTDEQRRIIQKLLSDEERKLNSKHLPPYAQ